MTSRLLLEFAGFQLVWWVSAIGAANATGAAGIATAAAFIACQLAFAGRRDATFLTACASGLVGLCAESTLASLGLIRYQAAWPSDQLAPVWIVALWMAFGTTLGTMAKALGRRPLITAAVLGAVLGPVTYVAGARVGALTLPEPAEASLIAFALLWAIAMPLLLRIQRHFENRAGAAAK